MNTTNATTTFGKAPIWAAWVATTILSFAGIQAEAQDSLFRKISLRLPTAGQAHHVPRPHTIRPISHAAPTPAPAPHFHQNANHRREAFIAAVRHRAEGLSRLGLPYIFGGSSPNDGGMDCSGTMLHLFSALGFHNIPRTSYHQYEWLNQHRTLRHTKSIPAHMGGNGGLKPGDLIFWGGTYNSGHKVSHVMLYLGQGPDGRHYMFGAKGKSKRGMNGAGVDIFELRPGHHKGLVGYGNLPGAY